MQDYIDIFHKESERHAEYPEQRTTHFEKVANITVDSNSVIIHQKQNGREKDCQANPYKKHEAKKVLRKAQAKQFNKTKEKQFNKT